MHILISHDLSCCLIFLFFRAMSVVAAPKTHGGAAESGQRYGCLVSQQCLEPVELGLLRVHWDDPRGKRLQRPGLTNTI